MILAEFEPATPLCRQVPCSLGHGGSAAPGAAVMSCMVFSLPLTPGSGPGRETVSKLLVVYAKSAGTVTSRRSLNETLASRRTDGVEGSVPRTALHGHGLWALPS